MTGKLCVGCTFSDPFNHEKYLVTALSENSVTLQREDGKQFPFSKAAYDRHFALAGNEKIEFP